MSISEKWLTLWPVSAKDRGFSHAFLFSPGCQLKHAEEQKQSCVWAWFELLSYQLNWVKRFRGWDWASIKEWGKNKRKPRLPWFVFFRVNLVIPAVQTKKKKKKKSGIYILGEREGEGILPRYLPISSMNYLVNMCLLVQYKLKISIKATKFKFQQKILQ